MQTEKKSRPWLKDLLVGLTLKEVAKLGDEHLIAAYHDALNVPMINRDKTAETIFSGNIDTWKNRRNMSLIGISEKEVMDFTDNMGAADQNDEVELNQYDYRIPEIDPDSLAAHLSYANGVK